MGTLVKPLNLIFAILTLVLLALPLSACPFCNPSAGTSDLYTIASNSTAVARAEKVGDGKYKILEVVKGQAKVGRVVLAGASREFSSKEPEVLLLSTVSNPKQPYWSEPVRKLTQKEFDFVRKALQAKSEKALWDLAAQHLENESEAVAESAYNILAPAPIEEVQKRAPAVGQKLLTKWAREKTVPSERKSLYILMAIPKLGTADKDWLRQELLNPPLSSYASHLPPLMIAYAEVSGPQGIAEMKKVFLKPDASASSTFGPTSGFAFMGANSSKPNVRQAARDVFREELKHPDRGVFAIAPLAEWRDFTVAKEIEKLADEHRETPWVISSVVRYFRSFENEEAKSALARLKAKYPKITESAQKPFSKAGD
jgi:hypothetical protein